MIDGRWDELFLEPAAPVLLRGLTIVPTRARYDDFDLVLDDTSEVNPVLLHKLAAMYGADTDGLAELAADPDQLWPRLRKVATVAEIPGFDIAGRRVIGTFTYAKLPMVRDLRSAGDLLTDSDVVAAVAGDPHAQAMVAASSEPDAVLDGLAEAVNLYRDCSGQLNELRKEHLERLGWTFHRIWSTNWFTDPATEAARVEEAYREAVEAAEPEDGSAGDGADAPEPGVASADSPARDGSVSDGPVSHGLVSHGPAPDSLVSHGPAPGSLAHGGPASDGPPPAGTGAGHRRPGTGQPAAPAPSWLRNHRNI